MCLCLGILTAFLYVFTLTDAVTLTGSSEYAVPGSDFTLTCDVPEEANVVTIYRRPDVSTPVGSVQVGGSQCYNTNVNPAVPCTPDVCSCVTTSTGGRGTVFRWFIQPQTEDHGSVWFCTRTNLNLTDQLLDSPDFTLTVASGPGTSTALSPSDTTYTRTEGDTLPDITCTADCRPGCTFVWTKPDNTNFSASAVLSFGQLDRSKHGTYRCTARNVVGKSTTTMSVTVRYDPGTSIAVSPPDTTYTRTEGDTLPDITCTADCRPGCTFVWTKPDNTNFTASAVLSLGQLNKSEHGTYRCTARNVVGESTTTTTIFILFPSKLLSLGYTQGDADVTENNPKSLICVVESFPPSTIQWYFKANNSLLFTDRDVLQSTYTLTTAGCLDTGLYTCSASNSVSDRAVTMDIGINVLCKPRLDPRVNHIYNFALATSESLTIPAMFISNPAPSFNWTFQTSPLVTATALVNGTDDFAIYNSYVMTNQSALSVGIRANIKQNWFGFYSITATNGQGSGTLSFTAEAKGKPSTPYEGTAVCPNQDQAILSWRSAFNGGSAQYFAVGIKKHQDGKFNINNNFDTSDPGQHEIVNITVLGLTSGIQHFFMVYAVNEFGNSTLEEEVNCTTKAMPVPESSPLGPILGGVGGSIAAIVVVIVVVVIVLRRKSGESKRDGEMITSKKRSDDGDDSSDGMKLNKLYESSDGLKANILYESAGPRSGSTSDYAVVDKTKRGKSGTFNEAYTEDVKSKGKLAKVDVYEKVGNLDGTADNVYASSKDGSKPVPTSGLSHKKNQDGLIYLDIDFEEDKKDGRNYVIHGIENRTDYVDVDFTKHADPLPPDIETNQPEEDGEKI